MPSMPEAENDDRLRAWTRRNITETLVSLNVNTVDDIQQIAAALAQCTVGGGAQLCLSSREQQARRRGAGGGSGPPPRQPVQKDLHLSSDCGV